MYHAVADAQGAAADRVVTTPQNEEFVARGTCVYPVEPSLRLVGDLIEFSARHYPRWNPVSVCGHLLRLHGVGQDLRPIRRTSYGRRNRCGPNVSANQR
jgi:methylmalonyl-CoA mutase N-terminal domain/subunit